MTELPIEPREKAQENLQHNWLYSVVPARQGGLYWTDPNSNNTSVSEIGIYLAGFCIICRHAFSVPIPFGVDYRETELKVPKFGCISPFAGL